MKFTTRCMSSCFRCNLNGGIRPFSLYDWWRRVRRVLLMLKDKFQIQIFSHYYTIDSRNHRRTHLANLMGHVIIWWSGVFCLFQSCGMTLWSQILRERSVSTLVACRESIPGALPLFIALMAAWTSVSTGGPVSIPSISSKGGASAGSLGFGQLRTSSKCWTHLQIKFYLSHTHG